MMNGAIEHYQGQDRAAAAKAAAKAAPRAGFATREGFTLRDVAPGAALLAVGLGGLLAASLSGQPSARGGEYLVIAAPWSDAGRTAAMIVSAQGDFLQTGGFGNIAIAAASHPDFAQHARAAGAWLVLPAPRLAGCLGAKTETSSL